MTRRAAVLAIVAAFVVAQAFGAASVRASAPRSAAVVPASDGVQGSAADRGASEGVRTTAKSVAPVGTSGVSPSPAVVRLTPRRPAATAGPARRVPQRVRVPRPATGAVSTPASTPRAAVIRGTASWYAAPEGQAAAGPALRAFLGANWRGTAVTVTANGHAVRVRLTDWMRADRLIDLNPAAFQAVCGALSRGLCRVEITR